MGQITSLLRNKEEEEKEKESENPKLKKLSGEIFLNFLFMHAVHF